MDLKESHVNREFIHQWLIFLVILVIPFYGKSGNNPDGQSKGNKESSAPTKPNVLIVVADQLVPMLTGPYGNSIVRTPHMDQLAKEGVTFLSAYSPNPLCAPARASMLTGKYSSNIGVYDNAALLAADEPTVCHSLYNLGYETALSGKVHFVGPDQFHGFSKRMIQSHYPTDFQWVKSRENKVPKQHALNYVGSDIHTGTKNSNYEFDESAHREAIQFLKSEERITNPFFLMVSYNFPHEPFYPPQKYWDMYAKIDPEIPDFPEGWEERLSIMDKWLNRHHGADKIDVTDKESLKTLYRAYYALITYVDDKLGELMETLKSEGMDENTVVIFTSDHGDMLGNRGMVQKRGFYEWSARVPLLLKLPGNIGAHQKVKTPVSLIDIVPTIFNYCSVPKDLRFGVDGQDLLPLIEEEDPSRYVISESHSEGVYTTCFMVRRGKYKYNYFHDFGTQLFDLESDKGEWNSLSGKPEFLAVETEMRNLIFKNFDPGEIEQDLRESIRNRMLIQPVLEKQRINWRYLPKN